MNASKANKASEPADLDDQTRLRASTRRRIEDAGTIVFVSSVVAWEIESKRAIGKLRAPRDLDEQVRAHRFTELPLHLRHVKALASLPPLRRDPFDRMLVAQALANDLILVTSDEAIARYAIRTLRAG